MFQDRTHGRLNRAGDPLHTSRDRVGGFVCHQQRLVSDDADIVRDEARGIGNCAAQRGLRRADPLEPSLCGEGSLVRGFRDEGSTTSSRARNKSARSSAADA